MSDLTNPKFMNATLAAFLINPSNINGTNVSNKMSNVQLGMYAINFGLQLVEEHNLTAIEILAVANALKLEAMERVSAYYLEVAERAGYPINGVQTAQIAEKASNMTEYLMVSEMMENPQYKEMNENIMSAARERFNAKGGR